MGVRVTAGSVSGGGGGASLVHQAKRTLDNDEIIHLPSQAIEIVGAPSADLVLFVERGILVAHTVVPYGGISVDATSYVRFFYGANDYASMATAGGFGGFDLSAVFEDGAITQLNPMMILSPNPGAGDLQFVGPDIWSRGDIAGQALMLFGQNTAGNFTNGDPANTLLTVASFYVLSLTLGQFLTTSQSGWNESTRTFA